MRDLTKLQDNVCVYINDIEKYQNNLVERFEFIERLKEDVIFAIKNFDSNIFYDIEHFNSIFKTKDVSPFDVNYRIMYRMNRYVLNYLGIETDLDKVNNGYSYPLRHLSCEYIDINYDTKTIELNFKKYLKMYSRTLEVLSKQLEDEKKNDIKYTSFEEWHKLALTTDKEKFGYVLYLKNLSFYILHKDKCKILYEKCKKSHLSSMRILNETIDAQKRDIERVNTSEEKYLDKIKEFAKEFDYTIVETEYED